ncbi:MAG: HD domain-containing protein [Deltaproteobacteria bacterium]|nr:HD domain-containing protein [Deltaproteobacteria bacterium]
MAATKQAPGQKKVDEPRTTVKRLAKVSDPDPRHTAQVIKLALTLFDKLKDLHALGARERFLLEMSAMLHDIGWSRTTGGGHHKHSRDMILEVQLPGLTETEQAMCALIARYHTKAGPDPARHKRFAALAKRERAVVSWLAAILRVADGLDCTHSSAIRIEDCSVDKKRLTILLGSAVDCGEEVAGGEKKSDVLGRMADRKVVFRR